MAHPAGAGVVVTGLLVVLTIQAGGVVCWVTMSVTQFTTESESRVSE